MKLKSLLILPVFALFTFLFLSFSQPSYAAACSYSGTLPNCTASDGTNSLPYGPATTGELACVDDANGLAACAKVQAMTAAGGSTSSTSQSVNICPTGFGNGLCTGGLNNLFGSIINIIFVIAILISLGFLIWGGISWITSRGEKTKVESARNTLIAALVGLIIVFLAFFLLNMVTSLLFGTTAQNLLNNTVSKGILN